MENPCALQFRFNGNALQVSGPGTFVSDWICDLEGMRSVSLQAKLMYGAGGQSVQVYFQTSLDQGQAPIDIWAPSFTNASAALAANIDTEATGSAITPSDGSLAANTIVNGILGDRLRAKVVVTGNYSGSTLLNLTGMAR